MLKKLTSFAAFVILIQMANAQMADAGYYHSIFVCSDSTVSAVGKNDLGQVGDGSFTQVANPITIAGLTGVTKVSAGGDHSVALKSDGTVWSWGYNKHGQLGLGHANNINQPTQITGLTGIISISCGEFQSFFLRNDGTVWACGKNNVGQLGIGTQGNTLVPVQLSSLSSIQKISAGQSHALALTNSGNVFVWGLNIYGQLGLNNTTNKSIPEQIQTLSNITDIATGIYHSMALDNVGNAWAWGSNEHGQIGDGTLNQHHVPYKVTGTGTVISVEAGQYHSMIVTSNTDMMSWGANNYGQLGDNSYSQRTTPVSVTGVNNIVTSAAGMYHSFAIDNSGSLWSWGFGKQNQLADGAALNVKLPQQVNIGCVVTDLQQPCNSLSDFILPSSVCVGDQITFVNNSIGGHDYQWEIDGVDKGNAVDLSHSFTADGVFEVKLIANPDGCSNTKSVNVTVKPLPDASFNLVSSICETDNPYTPVANVSGGLFNGTGINIQQSFDPASAGPGVHSIQYELTVNGCTNNEINDVTVDAMPIATINPQADVCVNGSMVNFTSVQNGGLWYLDGSLFNASLSPANSGPGTYQISYQIQSGTCNNSDQMTLEVFDLPDASFTAPSSVCEDEAMVTFSPAQSGGTWSGNVSPQGEFDPSGLNTGLHLIGYDITQNGCTNSFLHAIEIYPLPNISINGVMTACRNESVVLDASGADSWLWDNGQSSASATYSVDQNLNIQVTGVSINGCENSSMHQIIMISDPVAGFGFSQIDDQVSFSNNSQNFNNVIWDFGDGTTSTEINPEHLFNVGVHAVVLIASNDCGSDTSFSEITITSTGISATAVGQVTYYPNPVSDVLNISSLSLGTYQINVLDALGKIVINKTVSVGAGVIQVDMRNLSSGVYQCNLISEAETLSTRIVVK